jgi:hypothetical protein
MSEMSKFQLLIDDHYNIRPDAAKEVYKMADSAESAIAMGLASVGELMYFASENPEYDPESMRSTIFNIGLLVRCLNNFQLAIGTAKENAAQAIRAAEKGGAK